MFGEGAGVFIVEAAGHAAARGARVCAELLGRALNNDAYHMTAPEKEGKGIAALMNAALADAGIGPEQVGHINCHGTGTPYNDAIETRAIKAVFGAHAPRIPITANKSMIGHAQGAAGALEAISAIQTIREGIVPPTIHYETPDPECDLDCCPNEPRAADVEIAVSNSYGIGGTNASVVFKRWESG
jgi:3-oxoacyl-[acyl-carrier-protein] synthase II